MNYWIFQSVPDRFDLQDPKNLVDGRRITWLASRYRDRMAPGDLVFFWMAGEKEIRGIYGWGRLASGAYEDAEDKAFAVDAICERRLLHHLPVGQIMDHPVLRNMLIMRAPQATNFLLTSAEADALTGMIPQDERPEGA